MRNLTLLFVAIFALTGALHAQNTAFTYQGRLTDGAAPSSGTVQMQFALYDALTAGAQIGTTIENTAVAVNNGIFTVELDYGANAFSGGQRYLELRVRRNSSESYVVLAPRQKVTGVPYAIRSGATDVDPLTKNIAMMRWDLLRVPQVSYPLNSVPRGIAFDGTNIWVSQTGSVLKIRPSDGVTLATILIPTENRGMAFDGAHMWVTNAGSGVAKIRVSDGANLGAFPVGSAPIAAVFDGTHVWVLSQGSDNVVKLRASDGANLGTFTAGSGVSSIAFDGTNIWVSSYGSSSLYKHVVATGTGSFISTGLPVGISGLTFDGTHLWLSYYASTYVGKWSLSPLAEIDAFSTNAPSMLAFDGRNVWAVGNLRLSKFNANGSSADNAVTTYTQQFSSPTALAFDGTHIWFGGNFGTPQLVKISALP